MVKNILFIILIFLFSSCATLVTRTNYKVKITSNLPNAQAEILDSIYDLPTIVKLKRSKKDLKIKLITDSLRNEYTIKASPNSAFLYGNILYLPIAPLMYGIDFTNEKRFTYGRDIFLNSDDTLRILRPKILKNHHDYWSKTFTANQGEINYIISFPWINNFYLHPTNESVKRNTGYMGFSTGIEYFYKKNKFVALTGSAVMDFLVFLPAPVDYEGEAEFMYSTFVSLTNNIRLRRFSVGYGVSFSRNIWKLTYFDRLDAPATKRDQISKISNSIGYAFEGHHEITKGLYIGLIYRPSLVQVYPKFEYKYEHLISLDLRFKIRLKK